MKQTDLGDCLGQSKRFPEKCDGLVDVFAIS
jgi:hypothetical protein